MSQYTEQAQQFLRDCNATMSIEKVGLKTPHWDSKPHNAYSCIITTPKGKMAVKFYDSIANTEKGNKPTEYDVLACLQKYDIGTEEDFFAEFYGVIKSVNEIRQFKQNYNAAVKEYADVCRVFTEEQIEALQEIQ